MVHQTPTSGRVHSTNNRECLQNQAKYALTLLPAQYSINKSKVNSGFVGHQWERKILSELNSALNKWVDSIPAHCKYVHCVYIHSLDSSAVKWDSAHPDETFFHQSAVLHTSYYMVQILIHRQFISRAEQKSSFTLPALTICTNAARACAHILEAQQRRRHNTIPMQIVRTLIFLNIFFFSLMMMQGAAFMSGVVLLLKIWTSKREGAVLDPDREMGDVRKCMDFLKHCAPKYVRG
jgi:hypothetical protein